MVSQRRFHSMEFTCCFGTRLTYLSEGILPAWAARTVSIIIGRGSQRAMAGACYAALWSRLGAPLAM